MEKEIKFSDEYRTCFLCKRTETAYNRLERHHIFGNAYRDKSEHYGLVVYLCGERCHRLGRLSAHQNSEVTDYLHKYGQKKAMTEQGWSKEEFMEIFGRNYLE